MKTIKIIITSVLWLILVQTGFTQNHINVTNHMTFLEIPIDGTLNEYISKMKQKGFTLIEIEDGVALLKSDFASYKDCIIGVATLKGKDLVSGIVVIFPNRKTWATLASNYFNLKELLTEKYGEPSEVLEEFDTYLEPDDDNSKMYEVKMNNCKYYTTFELENGNIQLSIKNNGFSSSFVMLLYYDKINTKDDP